MIRQLRKQRQRLWDESNMVHTRMWDAHRRGRAVLEQRLARLWADLNLKLATNAEQLRQVKLALGIPNYVQ